MGRKRKDGQHKDQGAPQLTLNFYDLRPLSPESLTEGQVTIKIVPFVDAATLEARREAVRRVAQAGIFSLPSGLRHR